MSASSNPGRWVFPRSRTPLDRAARWTLARYLVWRVVSAIVMVLLFLTLVFYTVEVLPADPTRVLLPRGCVIGSCAFREAIIQQWALDKPVFVRYVTFLANILTGNLGTSVTYRIGVPVWTIIAPVMARTLAFAAIMTVIVALLSVPLGMRMARKKGGIMDQGASFLLALAFAVPPAILALIGLYLFAFVYPVFPVFPQPSPDPFVQFGNDLWFFVLPGLIFIAGTLGLYTWVVRDHPLRSPAELNALPPGEWRHEKRAVSVRVKETLPRFVAALPILFPWTLGTVLFGESVWGVNGLGTLLWYATQYQDIPLMVGIVIVIGLIVALPVVVVADILHHWMTMSWRRADAAEANNFRVDAGDPIRWSWRTLTSFFGLVGLVLILGIVVLSVAAPSIAGPYPTVPGLARPDLPPTSAHILGTDSMGRDLFTVLVYGGQPLIGVAALGFALALAAGIAVALATGFFGGRAEVFLVLPIDLFLIVSIPFVMLFVSVYGQDATVWGPALVAWPVAARLVLLDTAKMVPESSEVQPLTFTIRDRETRSLRLVWGAGPLILAGALLAISFTVIAWAIFGLFGLGPVGQGNVESWGQMVSDAFNHLAILRGAWWWFVPPIVCILVATLGPTLLSLQMRRVFEEAPRIVVPVEAPPPIATVVPPGTNP